ncbi:MAG: hypothetical protein ACAH59_08690, partial [Pseudobdellovibrionaceae bacterium]
MNKQDPRYFQRQQQNRRNMHDDRSRSRHYRQDMPDYGLWGDRIHRPSSGFSYSDAEAYDFE